MPVEGRVKISEFGVLFDSHKKEWKVGVGGGVEGEG